MFIAFFYSLISLKPLNTTNLREDMASKAYVFDPMDSPMRMSADVCSIREFLKAVPRVQNGVGRESGGGRNREDA